MKLTVDIPEKSLPDILRFSGERKKGPAITKLVASMLTFCRRQEILEQVREGNMRVDFPEWESARIAERKLNPWIK